MRDSRDTLELEGISKAALVVFDRNETGNKFAVKVVISGPARNCRVRRSC